MTTTPNTEELLPCPWCGGQAEEFQSIYARCQSKRCHGWSGRDPATKAQWNTRAPVRSLADDPEAVGRGWVVYIKARQEVGNATDAVKAIFRAGEGATKKGTT